VPTGPGLGIELDESRIAKFRRDGVNRKVHQMPAQKTGS
jgi:hypothetical protein